MKDIKKENKKLKKSKNYMKKNYIKVILDINKMYLANVINVFKHN
jgi:hypothetical protein